MKPIFKIGNWARTKGGYIGKIVSISGRGVNKIVDIETKSPNFDDKIPITMYATDIIKAHSKIIKVLEPDDFLDTHCIWRIDKDTIFLNEGWFIHESDILSLVNSITTHELFEKISYKVDEDE